MRLRWRGSSALAAPLELAVGLVNEGHVSPQAVACSISYHPNGELRSSWNREGRFADLARSSVVVEMHNNFSCSAVHHSGENGFPLHLLAAKDLLDVEWLRLPDLG